MPDTTTITPEERDLLKKVHRQNWDIDEGDMSIHRDYDGFPILLSDLDYPEEVARELAQVWQRAWPIVVRLETALKAAEAESATLRKRLEVLAEALAWGAAKDKKSIFDKLPFIDSKKKWIEYAEKEAARRAVAESEVGE